MTEMRRDANAELGKESAKVVKDEFNDCVDTRKDQSNGFSSSGSSLAKRYADGWIELHIHIFAGDSGEFCALFHSALVDGIWVTTPHDDGQSWVEYSTICSSGDEIEMSMFVGVAQGLKPEQHTVPVGVPSVVRLIPLDRCLCLPGHSFDFRPTVPLEVFGAVTDRECIEPRGGLAIGINELPSKVIEGGSEVVQGISDDRAKSNRRRRGIPLDAPDFLAGLRVELTDDVTRLRFGEGLNFPLQGFQVLVRPCNLQSWPRQRSHEVYSHHEQQRDRSAKAEDPEAPLVCVITF